MRKQKVEIQTRDVIDYENMMVEYNANAQKAYDIMSSSIDAEAYGTGVWDQEFKAFLDASTLKSLFFSEDWVFILVDLVANKLSAQPMRVMKREVVNGKEISKPAEGHPLQQKLEMPNQYQDYHAWMYGTVVDLTLLGNAIIWKQQVNGSLITLPAESIRMKFLDDGTLDAYETMDTTDADGLILARATASFKTAEIIHCRRPNPSSIFWGLSPFVPGRKSVLFNRYSSDYLNSFYLKGAAPGFALEMDKEANEKVALRLLRSFETAYTGRRNQRRTIVLPKGVSLKEVSHTLANQQLSIYIDKNRETIINLLKVPKHELSLQQAGSLGSEEAKTALRNFWDATLIPTIRIIEGSLNRAFAADLGDSFYLEFDLQNVDALQDDQSQKAALAISLLNAGWTVNEVRTKIWELPLDTSTTANQPYIIRDQQSSSPFGAFGLSGDSKPTVNLDGTPIETTEPTPMETTGEVTTSEDNADEGKDKTPGKQKANPEKLGNFLKSGDNWFEKREKTISDNVAKGVTGMERQALKMFADMAAAIIRTTRNYLQQKNYLGMATKADEQSKLVKRNELRRRLRSALDKFQDGWIDDTRNTLMATVEAGYNTGLQIPFNLPNQPAIEAIKLRNAEYRQQALEDRAERAFNYLNETTIAHVFDTIDTGITAGKTIQDIAVDLRAKFSDVQEIGKRAMMIARTETLTAVSLGQAAMMKDAAEVIPDLKKMWITAGDERVRASHAQLHGDVVDEKDAFDNGLQFPRDPSGPPEEVIQCRCTWIPLPADQMKEIDDNLLKADQIKE